MHWCGLSRLEEVRHGGFNFAERRQPKRANGGRAILLGLLLIARRSSRFAQQVRQDRTRLAGLHAAEQRANGRRRLANELRDDILRQLRLRQVLERLDDGGDLFFAARSADLRRRRCQECAPMATSVRLSDRPKPFRAWRMSRTSGATRSRPLCYTVAFAPLPANLGERPAARVRPSGVALPRLRRFGRPQWRRRPPG